MNLFDPVLGGRLRALMNTLAACLGAVAPILGWSVLRWCQALLAVLAVLVTGTHEGTRDIVNTLYGKGGVVRTDTWARLPGPFVGAGCTLVAFNTLLWFLHQRQMPEDILDAANDLYYALRNWIFDLSEAGELDGAAVASFID